MVKGASDICSSDIMIPFISFFYNHLQTIGITLKTYLSVLNKILYILFRMNVLRFCVSLKYSYLILLVRSKEKLFLIWRLGS